MMLRDQHHQRPLAAVRVQIAEGVVVTRFHQAGKAVERGVQQAVHLPHAAPRRNEAVDVVGKMDQPHLVALPQGHVAEHEHGVERMVQQGQPGRLVGHQPSAVDEEHDLLALGGLVIADGELVPPGGRPPIDPLVVVVDRVVAEPLEFVVLADLPRPPHAQQAEPIGAGQQGVLVQLLQVGIDVDGRRQRIIAAAVARNRAGCGPAGRRARSRMRRGGGGGARSGAPPGCGRPGAPGTPAVRAAVRAAGRRGA